MKRLKLNKNILIPAGTIVEETGSEEGYYFLIIPIREDKTTTLVIHEDAIRELNAIDPEVVIF